MDGENKPGELRKLFWLLGSFIPEGAIFGRRVPTSTELSEENCDVGDDQGSVADVTDQGHTPDAER